MSRSPRWIATLVLVCALGLALVSTASARRAPADGGSLAQRSNLQGVSAQRYANSFVVRRGSRLSVAGRPFRFAGANSESLGLRNYGPILSVGQHYGSERYPTRYEVDDDLATLHEMGATVVRAQTIGDTVGCSLCLEPSLGHFNARAFDEMDMVVAQARRYGIKIIGEFDGDANGTAPFGPPKSALDGVVSTDWYCRWRHVSVADCPTATFEDPRILGDYERHMKAVLDHVNPYTGLAYKNDPTFAGWVDGNNLWLLNATPLPRFTRWLTKVSSYFKSIDSKQLFIDIDAAGADYLTPGETYGLGPDLGPGPSRAVLSIRGVDVYGQEWYPKDFTALDPASPAATQLHVNARAVTGAGKVYTTIEFGWDKDNYSSDQVFARFLAGLQSDHQCLGRALLGARCARGRSRLAANSRRPPLHADLSRAGRGRQLVGALLHRPADGVQHRAPDGRPRPAFARRRLPDVRLCPRARPRDPARSGHHRDPGGSRPVRGQRRRRSLQRPAARGPALDDPVSRLYDGQRQRMAVPDSRCCVLPRDRAEPGGPAWSRLGPGRDRLPGSGGGRGARQAAAPSRTLGRVMELASGQPGRAGRPGAAVGRHRRADRARRRTPDPER